MPNNPTHNSNRWLRFITAVLHFASNDRALVRLLALMAVAALAIVAVLLAWSYST